MFGDVYDFEGMGDDVDGYYFFVVVVVVYYEGVGEMFNDGVVGFVEMFGGIVIGRVREVDGSLDLDVVVEVYKFLLVFNFLVRERVRVIM